MLNFCFAFSLANVLNMFYAEPRPYYLDPTVTQNQYGGVIKNKLAFQCITNYGNPDPFIVISISLVVTILLEMMQWSKWWLFFFAYVWAYGATMVLSRVLLGQNTYSQAIYGLSLGTWVALAQWSWRCKILKRCNDVLQGNSSGKSGLILYFCFWLIWTIMQLVAFFV